MVPAVPATPVQAAASTLGLVEVCMQAPAEAYMPAQAVACTRVQVAECMPARAVDFTLAPEAGSMQVRAVESIPGHRPMMVTKVRGAPVSPAPRVVNGRVKTALNRSQSYPTRTRPNPTYMDSSPVTRETP